MEHAQSVLQRRKSRSGNSLELNLRQILLEEGFREGVHFDYKPESEPKREPDFLFPNAAERVPSKHILTLQQGVSMNQFREITEAGITLVVPVSLQSGYPAAIRPHLQTLESFLGDLRLLG
ncbi:MAG: hypothetical protein F4X20_03755 [Dehalococcoidia bacterium]|nr:hypothetical protein [Dehalococcoidia bacterium]